MKPQLANESTNWESTEHLEKLLRAEGKCQCGRALAKVHNATLCEQCRNQLLGDLIAI